MSRIWLLTISIATLWLLPICLFLSLIFLSTLTLLPNLFTKSRPFNMTSVLNPNVLLFSPHFFSSLLSFPFQGSICAFDHISLNLQDLILWFPSLISPHFILFFWSNKECKSALSLKKHFPITLLSSELASQHSYSVLLINRKFTTI